MLGPSFLPCRKPPERKARRKRGMVAPGPKGPGFFAPGEVKCSASHFVPRIASYQLSCYPLGSRKTEC
jgi:hypothetical protein